MHLGHYSLFKTPFEPRVLSTIKRHRRNSSSPFGSAISETGSTLDPNMITEVPNKALDRRTFSEGETCQTLTRILPFASTTLAARSATLHRVSATFSLLTNSAQF